MAVALAGADGRKAQEDGGAGDKPGSQRQRRPTIKPAGKKEDVKPIDASERELNYI